MVAPKKELVNILYPTITRKLIVNPIVQKNFNMDMDINTPRERLALSSVNSFRELSVYSSVSFVSYHERMEIQNNKII